jgi:hypothetical protein
VDVKIHDIFWKDNSGWAYMMNSPSLKEGDVLLDGEKEYCIKKIKFDYPYLWLGNTSWVYLFEESIPDCKGKILKKKNV